MKLRIVGMRAMWYLPVLLHEFDEVSTWRLWQEPHAGAEGVLLGAEACVWRPVTLISSSRIIPVVNWTVVICDTTNT